MEDSRTAKAIKATETGFEATPLAGLAGVQSLSERLGCYLQLTKPTIMLLVLITGGTALILEGSFLVHPIKFFVFLLGLYMTGGAANAFNQYFERDIDSKMKRTMKRRPLPMGKISPTEALIFSALLGGGGVVLLGLVFNVLTAALSLGTLLFYSLFYTLYLKPNTPQNIVIGGIAGAMAPIGAWTAATGGVTWTPVILFLIVFFWTPPHFWSLALCYGDDYRKANLPMMPVIKGEKATMRQIVAYSFVTIGVSFCYLLTGGGIFYGISAATLGGFLLKSTFKARKILDKSDLWRLFGISIIYLFGLFLAMIIDRFVKALI